MGSAHQNGDCLGSWWAVPTLLLVQKAAFGVFDCDTIRPGLFAWGRKSFAGKNPSLFSGVGVGFRRSLLFMGKFAAWRTFSGVQELETEDSDRFAHGICVYPGYRPI